MLSRKFGAAVIDPINEERKGLAYIPDDNVPRSKENKHYLTPFHNLMLHHLAEKYKTNFLINIDFNCAELVVRSKESKS